MTAIPLGALSPEIMQGRKSAYPHQGNDPQSPCSVHADVSAALWGGKLKALMAHPDSRGRFAHASIDCPETACTGFLQLAPNAASQAWRNPEAIENIFCITGQLTVSYGPALEQQIALDTFDMVSIPADVKHRIDNPHGAAAEAVLVLSVPAGGSYRAVFEATGKGAAGEGAAGEGATGPAALAALQVDFDQAPGKTPAADEVSSRVTRFKTLVPYKKALSQSTGLPLEATERLSAGSVYPLIVPVGHVGRSQTAPMYGNQGLYMSIAECVASDDGPPPHAHSDTQETFIVLDGTFDIMTGLRNEVKVPAQSLDMISMPKTVMRAFKNTTGRVARLLVIIQGPNKMQDNVSFAEEIGEEFVERFGPEIIDKYKTIKMTFDARERLQALA